MSSATVLISPVSIDVISLCFGDNQRHVWQVLEGLQAQVLIT